MKSTLFLALLACALPAAAHEFSKDELKKAVLEVMRENKKEVFDIINQAAQDEQARRQKETEEQEKKQFEESFKNPMVPHIDSKTLSRGDKKAKFTLVEYSDFQCPYCQRGAQNVDALRKKYADKLRVVFKNLPLQFHQQAMPAARYFEAAALQSKEKAWEFHDKLFANQGALGEPLYLETAKALGLDVEKLKKDAVSKAVQDKINADMAEAGKFGFSGTPGYLINGIPVRGAYPVEHFDQIISRLDAEKKD